MATAAAAAADAIARQPILGLKIRLIRINYCAPANNKYANWTRSIQLTQQIGRRRQMVTYARQDEQ